MTFLLADDGSECGGAGTCILAADGGITVSSLKLDEVLAEAVASLAPDVALVDMARPDRDALGGILNVAARNIHVAVPFVDEDDPNFIEEAIGAGGSSYNATGTPPPGVKPIRCAAVALFPRHYPAQNALKKAESRLSERSVIDRAPATLIERRHLGKPDAYKWLRHTAMNRGRGNADIANEPINDNQGNVR